MTPERAHPRPPAAGRLDLADRPPGDRRAPSPAQAGAAARTLAVRATFANLRRETSHASELVSQLILGEEVRVLEETGGWLKVAGRDGYPGWAQAGSLAEPAGYGKGPSLVWSRRAGVLRESPGPDSAPLLDLVLGARVADAAGGDPDRAGAGWGRGGAARRVLLPDGTSAWTEEEGWVEEADVPERFRRDARSLLQTALSLRGVPYLWGGTSSKAFDCSGFVQRVFGVHGLALPRDAWQQAEVGVAIEPGPGGAGLEPGDLVFFAEGGGRVTHVAVALGERGRFVHASTRRAGVGLDGLDPADPLYAPKLAKSVVSCRRVL